MSFYTPNNNRSPVAHIGLDVTSFATAIPFYTQVLGALGWTKTFEGKGIVGFGPGYFVLILYEKGAGITERTGRGSTHVAFEAPSKQAVHDWYDAAIAAGAKGNGEPGPRPNVSKTYYAAHVLDPDGYRIEALYHLSAEEQ